MKLITRLAHTVQSRRLPSIWCSGLCVSCLPSLSSNLSVSFPPSLPRSLPHSHRQFCAPWFSFLAPSLSFSLPLSYVHAPALGMWEHHLSGQLHDTGHVAVAPAETGTHRMEVRGFRIDEQQQRPAPGDRNRISRPVP
eukprot:2878663-Rhodomonas_salina.1